ncbi:MAG: alkaline phosphatase family protein [Candidatus Hydrogenedentes bacterium]|nr:alkaline phosphatase family protein [Candidatus Hydrogenedentota bacterium]
MSARRPVGRVLVIGLDCATPQFIFGPQRFALPNFQRLMKAGCWGLLKSCDPPITVPAWACMMSGKDPGTLGIYGFRNRKDHSYDAMFTANATSVKEPQVWDILSRCGKKVAVIGVAHTYPVRPVNGWMVSGFLAPDTYADFTYPKELKQELREKVGEFVLDVRDFRTDDKDRLLRDVHEFMENRFRTAEYLLQNTPWDFFMVVEMGMDRLHHGFWKYADPAHPKFMPGNPYESAMREYYARVDDWIARLAAIVGDETAILIVSDHGAKPMLGGICINHWLIKEGYLALKEFPTTRRRIEDCAIDWSKTRVWSAGGYYGRIFVNVRGREPQGIVAPEDYECVRDELIRKLETMTGPDGCLLGNRVFKPQTLYRAAKGVPPDLLVYFGDLSWRAVGLVGVDSIYTFENDTGPDDANHDHNGIFIMDDRTGRGGIELRDLNLLDVAPTLLNLFGIDPLPDMQGKVIS